MRPDWSKPSFFPANRDGLSQTKLGGTMKNETYDIVIKCDTWEQRDRVLKQVDKLYNKPCGSVWHDPEGYRSGLRQNVTNVFFKESNSQEREVV